MVLGWAYLSSVSPPVFVRACLLFLVQECPVIDFPVYSVCTGPGVVQYGVFDACVRLNPLLFAVIVTD